MACVAGAISPKNWWECVVFSTVQWGRRGQEGWAQTGDRRARWCGVDWNWDDWSRRREWGRTSRSSTDHCPWSSTGQRTRWPVHSAHYSCIPGWRGLQLLLYAQVDIANHSLSALSSFRLHLGLLLFPRPALESGEKHVTQSNKACLNFCAFCALFQKCSKHKSAPKLSFTKYYSTFTIFTNKKLNEVILTQNYIQP